MLVYTYTFAVAPTAVAWLMEPIVNWIFVRATVKRFRRLEAFLAAQAADVLAWQTRDKPLTAPSTPAHPSAPPHPHRQPRFPA
ncbi:hypothetical protein H4CHR_00875 [Variovorax sp. PBS-H4]|nr:hypothetical protein H4CHR_00875 [Variovorax sp. PBS-H4]